MRVLTWPSPLGEEQDRPGKAPATVTWSRPAPPTTLAPRPWTLPDLRDTLAVDRLAYRALVRGVRAKRKPVLLFRLPAVFLLRLAARAFEGLLFQPPP